MEKTLILALKRIVIAYDQGRDRMAEIAMDTLDEAGAGPAHDGRNTPTTETETSP